METTSSQPLLRTLAPALRTLGHSLRTWLERKHLWPLSVLTRASLDGLADDLQRQADALQAEAPLLVIMLMGGTGVGKSTLLNALAGGDIAQASFARPTTRDPVVYYHESLQPHRLDQALQHCKLAPHNRPELVQKIIVDTPDLDSNDLANRDKLQRLLPVADVVLYVGSQEKYHDQLGWELFLHQRQRRAFAFVLNKWDRCLHPGASGLRPDQDLLQDLLGEGFTDPLLFRTCAQHWVDRNRDGAPSGGDRRVLPEGEQFPELIRWLELGLSRLEIEAIKARGVGQLLQQLQEALEQTRPPDLTEAAGHTRRSWSRLLAEEADNNAEVLLTTLEPYQKEIEHHFALERQKHFRGIMGGYLQLFNHLRYTGSNLRDRLSFLPRLSTPVATPAAWNLAEFTQACSSAASERYLNARCRALANRLLVEADQQHFPLQLLAAATENAAALDWRSRHAHLLVEVLGEVENQWAHPQGLRRWLHGGIVLLADWLPLLACAGMGAKLIYDYTGGERPFYLGDLLLPLVVILMVLVVLHVLIALFLPLRWQAIRAEFHAGLRQRLQAALDDSFCRLPAEAAEAVLQDRSRIDQLLGEVREVASWLGQREQAASITVLYGDVKGKK